MKSDIMEGCISKQVYENEVSHRNEVEYGWVSASEEWNQNKLKSENISETTDDIQAAAGNITQDHAAIDHGGHHDEDKEALLGHLQESKDAKRRNKKNVIEYR